MDENFEPLKWGILGTAGIAEKEFLPAIHKSKTSEPYAVASRKRERAKAYAGRNDIPNYYGDYEELLSDSEIEAVYIPLPNSLHQEWTIRSARAGKNVLCEKPLALDSEGAKKMFEECASEGVVLMEAFMYRFHPQTKRVKELIAEGVIGEPRMVRAGHSFPLVSMDRDDDFRWKEELGGGSLMDLGCYCVNTARYIFEEDPERVYSTAFYHPDYTAEAQLEGIMEFSNDRTAIIDSSFLLYDRAKFEVIGREGNIVVDHAYRSRGKDLEFRVFKDDEVEIERIEGVDEFMLEIDNFARALRGLEEQGISREDTIGNMRAIEALYKSSKRREPILLD